MMEDNRFRKIIKTLVIGDFVIGFFRVNEDVYLEMPFAGMAFYQSREQKAEFYFKLAHMEQDNSGNLLFGSSEFYNPTFLAKLSSGEYDWQTQKKQQFCDLFFRISHDWTTFTLYQDETGDNGESAFREFGSLFSYAVLNHYACVLHGVVMEYNGMGILVTAASGVGKTTHTRMWRDRENALILNGDRCLCRKLDGKWYAYGMPWAGSSGEYINRRVPITAIVCLKQAEENSVRRMSVFEGTLAMMQRIFAPVWRCEMQDKAFDMTEELATVIPMLELSCRPDFESVDVLKAAIEKLGETK